MINLLARIHCESDGCDVTQDFEAPQGCFGGPFGFGVGGLGGDLPKGWKTFKFARDANMPQYKNLCPACSEKTMATMKESDDE